MDRINHRLRRFPGGLLGMIALIVLVEGFIGGHGEMFRHPWAWDWHLADVAAREKVRDCSVLCFGDSLLKFGVAPRIIERESGLKSYNLSMGAGLPSSSYFLLRRALEAGARPKAVLIDAIPHLMTSVPETNAKLWPDLLSYRDCLELAWSDRNASFFASMSLAKAVPSVRDRTEVRASILAALNGQPQPIGEMLLPYIRNWDENRGAQMSRRPPGANPALLAAWAPWLVPPSWKPSDSTSHYLREFFRLAADHGIKAYWVLPPLEPGVQALREQLGRDAEYLAYIKAIQAEHPEVVVLDARHSGYGVDEHLDPMHLELRGAVSLSRDIAQILKRDPSTLSRWEAMPAFREMPSAEVALEEIGQSFQAVAAKKLLR